MPRRGLVSVTSSRLRSANRCQIFLPFRQVSEATGETQWNQPVVRKASAITTASD